MSTIQCRQLLSFIQGLSETTLSCCLKRNFDLKDNSALDNWYLKKMCRNLWLDSAKPSSIRFDFQGLHWNILNYKIFSGLPLLDKNWCKLKVNEICEPKSILPPFFLIGSHPNQLPCIFHNLNGIQTSRISV